MSELDFLKSLRRLLRSDRASSDLGFSKAKVMGANLLLSEDIAHREDHMDSPISVANKRGCDVLVITPTLKELRMTALAFDRDFDAPEKLTKSLPIFSFELPRMNKLVPLKVVICTINRQRNVYSGPKTSTKIDEYQPRLVVLTGIAGTKNDKELGEVTCASRIVYTAGGVETIEGKQAENDDIENDEAMYNLMHRYEELRDKKSVSEQFRSVLSQKINLIDGELPTQQELSKYKSKFSVKKLMSGETLRKDGRFTEQAAELDRLLTMVEMEAAGFAIACRERGLSWLVFRGSCDFANAEKDDRWQRVAALSSAMSVRQCLETLFMFEEEMRY